MSDIDENSDRRLSDTSEKYEGTEHYTLVKTKDGWHGDPDGYSWQWFDFPDITFTDDGDCHFELEAEAIDMAVELDTYVYGQINVYGVTTKSERHKRSYWTRTADGNGIGGRKAPVPYGS